MAWTDKARAASAASRRAHKKAKVVNPVSAKGPLSARLKRQAKRATITVARKDRQAERVYTGGNAQRHIGRPRSGYNRMDPPGYVRSARERADAVRSIAKTTKRPAQMAERLQFGKETWGQPKASKAYSTYNADKRKLSKPVSGKRAGSAVTAMGDAAKSHPNTHLEDQQWAAKQYGGHPSDYGRNPKNGNLINSHRAFKLGKPKKRK